MDFPKPGELNRRIMLKNWIESPNASGGIDQNKPDLLPVWAKRQPVGAGIWQGSVQVNNIITDRFLIRWRDDIVIDNNVIIICDGHEFRITRHSDLNDAKRFFVIEAENLGAWNG